MNLMTIGQLDRAVGGKEPIYIQATFDPSGDNLVELTDQLRGCYCLLSWEVSHLFTLENGAGMVAQVALPNPVVMALEDEEPDEE